MTSKQKSVASPTVSVVIPTYNREQFLTEAIDSVYDQSVAPAEVLVVNDGSTDGTEALLHRLAVRLPSTFRWVTKENGGPAAARNLGIKLATGQFIAFLDSDDVWSSEKLARQLDQFATDPSLALSFTAITVRSERVTDPSFRPPDQPVLPSGWNSTPEAVIEELVSTMLIGTTSTVMVRREAFDEVGGFDEALAIADDHLMWLKVAAAGMKFDHVPEPMVQYRMHETNITLDSRKTWGEFASVYEDFVATHDLSRRISKRIRKQCARWHLLTAIEELQAGSRGGARHHILKAALVHPSSIRPGWLRMLGSVPAS